MIEEERPLPTAKLTRATEQKAKLEAARKEHERIKRAVAETFATESGRTTLRWLKEICGYQKFGTVADPATGEVNVQSTLYNEYRRSVYLTVRKLVSRETLISVEIHEDEAGDLI